MVTSVVLRLWFIMYPVEGSLLGFPVVWLVIRGASSSPALDWIYN